MRLLKVLAIAITAAIGVLITAGIVGYGVGAGLPVNHSTTVSGIVEASPAKVFAIITDVADGASWRSQVKTVQVLPPDAGRDHWVEDLGHGQTMSFVALATQPPGGSGQARRQIQLADPGAAYGGTWTYALSPGPNANQTNLQITEDGFIHPPIYRFMMVHVMGMNANLQQYLHDLQVRAKQS